MKKFLSIVLALLIGIPSVFAQSTRVSREVIPMNWNDNSASVIVDEVMREVFSHLGRFEFYHVSFQTKDSSATNFWINEVVFLTWENPSSSQIEMTFNYFAITFSFSNQRLSMGGESFRNSWGFGGLIFHNQFRRDVNETLNRASLRMRGMTFSNRARYQTDRRWLEALRLPLV